MSFFIPIKNLEKNLTEFFVCIFVFVCLCVVIFLGLYYLTPNNYIIEEFKESEYDLTKTNEQTKISFEIKPYSELKLNIDSNHYYKFENINDDSEKFICLVVRNWFKSQNVIINNSELIKISDNTECYILNNNQNNLIVQINSYKKK